MNLYTTKSLLLEQGFGFIISLLNYIIFNSFLVTCDTFKSNKRRTPSICYLFIKDDIYEIRNKSN